MRQDLDFGGRQFGSIKFAHGFEPAYRQELEVVGILLVEVNGCRVVLVPADPNYTKTGRHEGNSWGERLDDQWAIKRVGFTADEDSAWNQVQDNAEPVVVAVIDTGLDWHHKDISPENIWRNTDEVPGNGIDDDSNGYVDDVIGWNFLGRNNMPWDFDGHGTVVAGIIAATQDNDIGIAGINPHAKIMVLKGVNNFGTTRASYLAEAIKYAADNGAQLINLSVGGVKLTQIEQAAIDYAHNKGLLVIAASGNEGIEFDDYAPSGAEHVLTVGATHTDDRTAGFSNYGEKVDLVAPGVDILSLRARFTDTNFRPETADEYTIGDRYVGDDNRYLHVNGTSFSTPIVTGVASLIMSKHPQLSAADVERLLYETAEDIEFPGKDKYAGHGMVDAKAALSAEPDFFITAEISSLEFQQTEDKDQIRVVGSIDAQAFKRAWLEIGAGENPARWKAVGQKRKRAIENGTLSTIDLSEFAGSDLWQVVVNVEHSNGVIKKVVRPLRIK
jgi:subtilisin family serine protease